MPVLRRYLYIDQIVIMYDHRYDTEKIFMNRKSVYDKFGMKADYLQKLLNNKARYLDRYSFRQVKIKDFLKEKGVL